MGGGGGHHGGGHHHGGGGGRGGWGWGGYPMMYGGSDPVLVIDNASNGCVVTDSAGIARVVPCALSDDEEEAQPVMIPTRKSSAPIMRTAINVSAGGKGAGRGSSPYYRFAAMPRNFPFDWNGRPGGVPQSRVAGESRELSGADLVESGLDPNAKAWPPLASRNFRLSRPASALSGLLDGLSDNEVKVAKIAVALGALALIWRKLG